VADENVKPFFLATSPAGNIATSYKRIAFVAKIFSELYFRNV